MGLMPPDLLLSACTPIPKIRFYRHAEHQHPIGVPGKKPQVDPDPERNEGQGEPGVSCIEIARAL